MFVIKKFTAILTVLTLIVLCGCGNNGKDGRTPVSFLTDSDSGSTEQKVKADDSLYKEIVDSETAWLASLQLENGAIPMTATKNGEVSVNPYFSDFSALALLDKPDDYVENVKKYMDWHFSHLNTKDTDYNGIDGTIYDYSIVLENGKIKSEAVTEKKGKKSYDSTDSYAATFICVLKKYYEKTSDNGYLRKNSGYIKRIIDAMLSTMDNGLTLSKPDYEVKYLMDNCEVYEALDAAIKLYEKPLSNADGVKDILSKIKTAKSEIKSAMENKMWNKDGKYFEAGLFKDESVAFNFSWDTYYPCATGQMFTIFSGVLLPDDSRAKDIYNSFCNKYAWENFDIPDSFYWGSNVYTAAVMGDKTRVDKYLSKYKKVMKHHAYPLYNADAARVSMAAAIMINK